LKEYNSDVNSFISNDCALKNIKFIYIKKKELSYFKDLLLKNLYENEVSFITKIYVRIKIDKIYYNTLNKLVNLEKELMYHYKF